MRFQRFDFPPPPDCDPPVISNVNLVHLTDPRRLDVLACDMKWGLVMLLKPYEPAPAWKVLAKVPNPCHTEVLDLDGPRKGDDGFDAIGGNLSVAVDDYIVHNVNYLRDVLGIRLPPV